MQQVFDLISSLYQQMGIDRNASSGDLIGLLALIFLFVLIAYTLFRLKKPSKLDRELIESPAPQEGPRDETTSKKPWQDRLSLGLERSRGQVWSKLFGHFSGNKIDQDLIEEVEEILYGADIGPSLVMEIIDHLESNKDQEWDAKKIRDYLYQLLYQKMEPYQQKLPKDLKEFKVTSGQTPQVIMVVGVNGAGKTTTIGKLATKLVSEGNKVVVGACDTFRAAAVDQLQVWCERSGATMIRAKEGSAPSGVGFQALETAQKEKADFCILDTAGRLHTKGNLMQELQKSRDVLKKLNPDAPHHILLVIDAISGQNALRQAEEFHKTLGLTGIVLTKCDGSSKAGSAVSIVDKLQIPVVYIGVGEQVEDLNHFELNAYLNAMMGGQVSAEHSSLESSAP